MNELTIYLITTLDSICLVGGIIWTITLILGVVFLYSYWSNVLHYSNTDYLYRSDKASEELRKLKKKLSIIGAVLFFITTLIVALVPNSKEMAAILIIPKIATTENIDKLSEIPADLIDLANKKVREWKEEDKDSKEDKKSKLEEN
jgi:hypothetical protein